MIVLLMGVSGSGKSTVGSLLAADLGWMFLEGDSLHPAENIARMARGEALNDADREPWLDHLRAVIDEAIGREVNTVVAASLLKRAYRTHLGVQRDTIRLVYLKGTAEVIRQRMERRRDHFMPPELLESQMEALEEPEDSIVLNIEQAPKVLVAEIRRRLDI